MIVHDPPFGATRALEYNFGMPFPLPSDAVHIYRLRLHLPHERLQALAALLDAAEIKRARRFYTINLQREYTAAHGQMREILAAYVDTAPKMLRFHLGPQGKPYLPGSLLRFNLSHAGGTALLAVGWEHELGVDIEDASRSLDFANIAARFFAPQERQELLALPEAEQPAAFFRCWTAKEAYIKALGGGLSIPLDSFIVSLGPGGSTVRNALDVHWRIFRLDAGPGYAAALAARSHIHELACWRWTDSGRAPSTPQEPLTALPG